MDSTALLVVCKRLSYVPAGLSGFDRDLAHDRGHRRLTRTSLLGAIDQPEDGIMLAEGFLTPSTASTVDRMTPRPAPLTPSSHKRPIDQPRAA